MASGPYSAPWTDTGRLQGDVDRINSELHRKADSYEVSSLNSKLDSVERTCGELRTEIDEFRNQLEHLRENFRQALDALGQISSTL